MQLSEELLHRRHQEEEEAQHLESMVQSVEKNLCLMTVRSGTPADPPAGLLLLTVCPPVPACPRLSPPVRQRRAVRAETSVSRLKAELQQLQVFVQA